jgi:release factor glutamine methyltransferase
MKVQEALREATRRLAAAGVPSSAWDAELLLLHVLGWDRAQLLTRLGEALPEQAELRYLDLVSARAQRKPLQHITRRQAFWRREFEVSPDVLIPRPETEIVVEAALAHIEHVATPLVVDVGTGSGCIAVGSACARPDDQVAAIDVSSEALAVARRNAERLGCLDHVYFHAGDLLQPVADLVGTIDLVVSNPPYVDRAGAAALEPEVREHEPAVALFPDGDVESVYRRLIPAAARLLRHGGWLVTEVGIGMAERIRQLCRDAGFVSDTALPDLRGILRVVAARKPER